MPGAAWPGGGGRERGEALCQQANTCPSRPARQALRYMQHCPAGPGISAAPNDPKQGGSAHLWPCRLARLRAVGAGGSRRAACPLAELHLPQVPAVPQVEHRQAGGEPCRSGGGDRQWCGSQQKLACACSLPQCERQQAGNRSVTARGSGQELASRRCPSCLPEAAMTA